MQVFAKITAAMLLIAVTLFTFSCDKEAQIEQDGIMLQDIEQYLGVEINDPKQFPETRPLSDEEVEKVVSYIHNRIGLNESGQPEGEAVSSRGPLKLFEIAIVRVGMLRRMLRSEFTVFAPEDAVFESLGLNSIRAIFGFPEDELQAILEYHIIPGQRLFAADLESKFYPTMLGPAVEVNIDNGVTVNGVDVVSPNNFSSAAVNSVVHFIDELLVAPDQNIVEIAIDFANSSDPEFTQLVAAVVRADLAGTLSGDGPFTVFAPTDAAFQDLYTALGVSSVDEIDVSTLTDVLLYHVVPARVFSTDLTNGPVSTLNGTVSVDVSDLTLDDSGTPDEANLVPSLLDVQGTNGVIHVIDKVLLP
jgi:uncharacterized surface protein with fasciclin (FAS1) repeats